MDQMQVLNLITQCMPTIAPKRSLLLVLLATTGAGVDAEVKSPNSACKPSRSEEAEDVMVAAAGCLAVAVALTGAGLPIRPRRSAEAEVEAGTLLFEAAAVTGRGGSVLATAGLFR